MYGSHMDEFYLIASKMTGNGLLTQGNREKTEEERGLD
jgi:hypothetical protein